MPLGFGRPLGSPPPHPTPAPAPAAVIVSRLARSENYKGHRELIAAWPRVLERMPTARLEVAGEGDLRPELEAMARKRGVGEHVRFHGRVSEERKRELMTAARCFAMPSRAEGFGIVYAEAMRLGRPCLVSDRDAGREVVNPPEAGLAVDPDDGEALVDATVRLLTTGCDWDRWSAAAFRRYEQQFTAARFQDRLVRAVLDSSAPEKA